MFLGICESSFTKEKADLVNTIVVACGRGVNFCNSGPRAEL